MPVKHDLLVLTASNGENLKLAERFVAIAKELGTTPQLLDLTKLDFLKRLNLSYSTNF